LSRYRRLFVITFAPSMSRAIAVTRDGRIDATRYPPGAARLARRLRSCGALGITAATLRC
jgi:hypothetical protein